MRQRVVVEAEKRARLLQARQNYVAQRCQVEPIETHPQLTDNTSPLLFIYNYTTSKYQHSVHFLSIYIRKHSKTKCTVSCSVF